MAVFIFSIAFASCSRAPETRTGEALSTQFGAPRRLDLTPCQLPGLEREARCGTLEVYENRAARAGRKIGLRVAVLPAEAQVAADPLFIIVGGPGQSAVATAGAFAAIFAEVLRERDVVLLDQRGSGGSNPLNCVLPGSDDDPQSYLGDFLPVASLRQCLAQLDADPAFYTTPLAMDDLDDVRAALGYERINVYGSSYGTRAALVYLRSHPERVRSATLRGLVPTGMKVPLYYARDSQRALDLVFQECEADAACRQAYPGLRERFAAVQDRLALGPVAVELPPAQPGGAAHTIRLSRDDFNEALRNRLYNEEANLVPSLIAQSAAGDFTGMAKVALRFRRAAVPGRLSAGLFLSITCAEDVPFIDPQEAERLAAGTFLGLRRVEQQIRACKIWPRGELPAGFTDDVRSDAPALLISGDRDPVAPPAWGEQVASHLPESFHLVIRQGFHGLPDPCITRIMNDFIRRGTADGLDTSCTEQVERAPFVLPASDAPKG